MMMMTLSQAFHYLMQEAGDNARPKSQRHISSGPLSSRCSRKRFPPSALSSSKVLFEGALSAVYTLLFFYFKWGLYWECVRRLWACKRDWRHLLWPITSSLDTSNLTSGITKHYKYDQLGSWILISWCNVHSVILAKRHCLQRKGSFSFIFTLYWFVAENIIFLLVQWPKPLKYKACFPKSWLMNTEISFFVCWLFFFFFILYIVPFKILGVCKIFFF